MLSLARHGKLMSTIKADSGRPKGVLFYSIIAGMCATAGLTTLRHEDHTFSLTFLYAAALFIFSCISLYVLRTEITKGRGRWSQGGNSKVVLVTTSALSGWEFGLMLLFSLSIVVGIILFPFESQKTWRPPALLIIVGAYSLLHLIPILKAGGPTRRRIALSKDAVELTRIDGHTDTIPWKAHPILIGIRQGYAIIILESHYGLRYPMSYLPMSMRQFERLLNTFSTDGRLRAKLSGPEALSTVLAVLEPTEEERTDGSWTWYSSGTTAKNPQ